MKLSCGVQPTTLKDGLAPHVGTRQAAVFPLRQEIEMGGALKPA
jgi:hypothetical protein